jgi:hypothetical protein
MDNDRNLLLFLNYQKQQDFYKTEKIILSKIHEKFDTIFREKTFVISLSEFIEVYSNLVKVTGTGLLYQQISSVNAYWDNMFIEPIRNTVYRTRYKIHSKNNYSLFHYDLPPNVDYDGQGRDEEDMDKQKNQIRI